MLVVMRKVAAWASVVLVAAGCGSADTATETAPAPMETAQLEAIDAPLLVFPGAEWDAEPVGDWTALDATLQRDASTCVAVVKDGKLVHEAYFNGGGADRPERVYSITKSLTALLVGIRVDAGDVALSDHVARWVPQWQGTRAADVTVHHLLSMTSGRRWSEQTDDTLINRSPDQTAFAIGLDQVADPGQRWVYDNAAPQVLERVLGDDVVGLARTRLFAPLQMTNTTWPTDRAGNATTYSGVRSTCRDLARIGWLVLNGGRWDSEQIVSADFVRQMTSGSSALNAAYGLLWWTNDEGRVVQVLRLAGFPADIPPYRGRLAPNVPGDASWAFGYGNQYVAVVPSEGVVAVRLGRRPATAERVTFDTFTAGVLDALE